MAWNNQILPRCAACTLAAALMLSATGCGKQSSTSAPSDGTNRQIHVKSTTPGVTGTKTKANAKEVAAHLEHLAEGVKGVQHANCVVFGKYAVVGIDVQPAMERSRVGTVKYAVAEAFRKDPYGIDAVVTADVDMAQRIREIRADVKRGRPLAGFAEEMADIVGRLVPQMPRNVIPPAQPDHAQSLKNKHLQTTK